MNAVSALSSVTGFEKVEPIDSIKNGVDRVSTEKNLPAKRSMSFSQMLDQIKQNEKMTEITSASAGASVPAQPSFSKQTSPATVDGLSSALQGDYISSFKKDTYTPADLVARPTGDGAKFVLAKNATIDKSSKLYEQSQELESYFVKIMINTMRSTLKGSAFGENSYASKMYQDMMYDELSRKVTQNAGFGLADQIYLQLSNGSLEI